jgi:xylan 1,4-beta-xylosidase
MRGRHLRSALAASVALLAAPAAQATPTGGTVIASRPISLSPTAPVYLRIQARDGRYDFSYAMKRGEWTLLAGDVDGTVRSTKVAGGFVGTPFGMYAYASAE